MIVLNLKGLVDRWTQTWTCYGKQPRTSYTQNFEKCTSSQSQHRVYIFTCSILSSPLLNTSYGPNRSYSELLSQKLIIVTPK